MSKSNVTDMSIFTAPIQDEENFTLPWDMVKDLVVGLNRENANVPQNPEATNLTIAEIVKRQYALRYVFSREVGEAHERGDIRLHDLGMIERPYCSGHNPAFIARFGLSMPDAMTNALPAKHPEVLIAQIIKFSAALQGVFAGAIGWDAFNMFIAPYLVGKSYGEIKQLAQILIFEFSQQAVARGGQAIFSDINLYWEIPAHFRDTEAILPGGVTDGSTYADYEKESKLFFRALMEVYTEGDGLGRPFFFPKPDCHITDAFWEEEDWEEGLRLMCEAASKMGAPYFIFDRGDTVKIAECCRLTFELTDEELKECATPWMMRSAALQNVTINLPRIAYQVDNFDDYVARLKGLVDLAIQAHEEKRDFIFDVLDMPNSPLALLTMNLDGMEYIRRDKVSYLIGILGLNEAVEALIGKSIDTVEGDAMAHDIMWEMSEYVEQRAVETGLRLVIEQTPAESTSYGLAKLDMEQFPLQAGKHVHGTRDAPYYTNSSQLPLTSDASPIERIRMEGRLHPLINAGAITHIWIGESDPNVESLMSLIRKIHFNSSNVQVAFSPEFTACLDCSTTTKGLGESCPRCGSERVENITRVTGYFSKTAKWNKGKVAELEDRERQTI